MKLLSSAKINLNLTILPATDSDLHELISDIIPVDIFDEIGGSSIQSPAPPQVEKWGTMELLSKEKEVVSAAAEPFSAEPADKISWCSVKLWPAAHSEAQPKPRRKPSLEEF